MINAKTLELINWATRLGYYMRVLPWLWNSETGLVTVKTKWEMLLWKLVSTTHIIIRIVFVTYCGIVILIFEVDEWEKIFFSVPLSILSISAAVQMFVRGSYEGVQMLSNSMIRFNAVMFEFYEREAKDEVDRLAGFRRVIVIFPISMTLLTWPAFTSILSFNLKSFAFVNLFDFIPGYRVWIGFGVMYLVSNDCVVFCTSILILLAYFNSTLMWLENHKRSKVDFLKWKEKGLLQMYRALRFQYYCFNTFCSVLFIVGISFGTIFIASTSYSVIYLFGEISFSIIVLFGTLSAVAYFVLHFIFHLINEVTDSSAMCVKLLLINSTGKWDKRYLRSCRPLYWNVGPFFRIKHSTFATLTKDFILNAIINLLLTWGKQKSNIHAEGADNY